tara:strand:+ start:736 stop:909 length:174 start_codon:yes stop_codon:yes gene_type:complete
MSPQMRLNGTGFLPRIPSKKGEENDKDEAQPCKIQESQTEIPATKNKHAHKPAGEEE